VLRTDLSGDPTFRELLRRAHEVNLAAHVHSDLPFERLVEELRSDGELGGQPLFQVMFGLQDASTPVFDLSALDGSAAWAHSRTAAVDLALSMVEAGQGLTGCFDYPTELFHAATIGRMLGHFQRLLEAAVTDS